MITSICCLCGAKASKIVKGAGVCELHLQCVDVLQQIPDFKGLFEVARTPFLFAMALVVGFSRLQDFTAEAYPDKVVKGTEYVIDDLPRRVDNMQEGQVVTIVLGPAGIFRTHLLLLADQDGRIRLDPESRVLLNTARVRQGFADNSQGSRTIKLSFRQLDVATKRWFLSMIGVCTDSYR